MSLDNYEKIESSNIDFKVALEVNNPKSWLKSVSAFANTNGGIILFGINDKDRVPIGLVDVNNDSEKVSELINAKIEPIPRFEMTSFAELGLDFLELKIGDGPRTPYYYVHKGSKEAFVRSGNQSIPAPKHMLESLILKGQNITYDELPSKYKIEDVSFTLLNATLKKEQQKEINKDKDYVSLELVTTDNHVTNAGLLLCDQGLLNQSRIFCTRWNGLVKGSVSGDAIDDKEYTGSIIFLLENAEAFIRNNSKVSWEIQGMKRIEKEDYPLKAVREAIVNSIIHRDYQILGSEIHIDMYDDRLEIVSPGGMIDGTYIQDLDITKISSMRRNRIISDIFNRLKFMDRRGSGLTRIIESYSDYINKPQFCSDVSSFKAILPNKGYIIEKSPVNDQKSPVTSGNVVNDEDYFVIKMFRTLSGVVNSKTIEKVQNLFDSFKYHYSFRREDVEKIFDVKKSRASEIVSQLLELGLIEDAEPTKYKFKK